MRYEIIYKYGGIYLDIDMEVFKNLEPLLKKPLVICNEDKNSDKYMSIGFIACSKGNRQLKNNVDNIKNVDFNTSINVGTGPYYFRKYINIDDNVLLLPTSFFYPSDPSEYTYAAHHFDKNWE